MEPRIAVDASGNINVVWRDEPNSNVLFTRSTDGGVTFSIPAQVSGIPGGGGPSPFPLQIATDSAGTIHILAGGTVPQAAGSAASDELFYARSVDGGKTFLVTPITHGQGFIVYVPVMTLGPNGSINIVWMSSTDVKLSVSRSTDGGATFLTTTVWNWPGSGEASGVPQLAVDASENIYLAWDHCGGTAVTCSLLFSKSIDQGKTYSTSTTLGAGMDPAIAFDQSGDLNLVWSGAGIFFRRSTDHGATFSASTTVSQSGGTSPPQIAVDSKAEIFVIWSPRSSSLLFSRSTDGGSTFSPPQTPGNLVGISQIAVDSSSNIDIVAAGTASDGSSQILVVRSTDQGTGFSDPMRVSDDTKSLCPTFSEMALEKGGNIDVVWEQFPTPFGSTGVPGCDSIPNQVLFSRGVVTRPDFTISVAPETETVLPGGTAKFTVTLTASGGFSDEVNLSCSKLPAAAECTFDSESVTPKNSGSQVTLTVTTAPTLAQGDYSVTIAATSGDTKHTQQLGVVLGGLSGSVVPTSATIAIGGSATFAVGLTTSGGFGGPVNLGCSGAASGVSCKFNPAQVSLGANGSGNSTLTVSVSSKPSISLNQPEVQSPPASVSSDLLEGSIGFIVFAVLSAFWSIRRELKSVSSRERGSRDRFFGTIGGGSLRRRLLWSRSATGVVVLMLTLLMAVMLVSCGGATTSNGSVGSGVTNGGGTAGSGGSSGASGTGGSSGGGSGSGGSSSVTLQFVVEAQSGGATVNLGILSITIP